MSQNHDQVPVTADGPSQEPPAREPTPGETAAPMVTQEAVALAEQDESAALEAALQAAEVSHLHRRVVTLNLEIRLRDQRITDLEAEVADLRAALMEDQPAETGTDQSGGEGSSGVPHDQEA